MNGSSRGFARTIYRLTVLTDYDSLEQGPPLRVQQIACIMDRITFHKFTENNGVRFGRGQQCGWIRLNANINWDVCSIKWTLDRETWNVQTGRRTPSTNNRLPQCPGNNPVVLLGVKNKSKQQPSHANRLESIISSFPVTVLNAHLLLVHPFLS